MSSLEGKKILVTGGCGSIGSGIVKQCLERDPAAVRVFDNDEEGLFHLERKHEEHSDTLRMLLGDIRDESRLEMAVEDVDVVFHAAALKHVEISEYNPFEAVQTNIQGTQNLINAAREENVESLLAISTDKASNPTSVMGATKLLSERLVIAANTYKGNRQTKFGCVRFGNVLGSSGSVVPLFIDQVRDGGPLTVTDPDMTRFLMSIERAVEFVLKSHARLEGGEVFILKMPAFKLEDLAVVIRDTYAPRAGYDPEDIEIEIIGPRPAERTHEKLISADERRQTKEEDKMFVLYPEIDLSSYTTTSNISNSLTREYTSEEADLLSSDELSALIESQAPNGGW
ncbi:SDR family NAD(P)-dependent oxidoreductase [Halomicrobium mukohataei]|uniref:Polysaccharide biosynthesis protein CapD n=2 Tax=Halomicrobium mukohataei TaxID=57705 RepID=C7P3B5_HALMD|nr:MULTISPECIES: SDR family NAD(P)-dependent oxidoreductase [Halomicrobium]ACV47587.1 polysaccharide biosynthesis protein CapD [Halomicrobium mukohataei DSM 12286]QCD66050.1 SDR family NAD(P)-dependent oxidoreductase [Halomicrobium mukohataei]QFR20855.1 SDR family NAD(P)-dependent oxidoreductase [Halomicrobium sp. ZPS1]